MCGIVGFSGKIPAAPVLLDGLAKLEYRGYDSTGICTFDHGEFFLTKKQGRLSNLAEATDDGKNMPGEAGIGHTRWATHGAPSDVNAHPHMSWNGKIVVVHNGIIENYLLLKEMLTEKGVTFQSETDTEVACNLLAWCYEETGDLRSALLRALDMIEGSYALVVMCKDVPGTILSAKKASPLIYGFGKDFGFVASDVTAVLRYTREVVYLDDDEIVEMDAEHVTFLDRQGNEIQKTPEHVDWEISAAEKGGYDHFMLKEIYEQPTAFAKTISPRIRDHHIVLDDISLDEEYLKKLSRIYVVACGSAYYVGCVGKYVIEKLCRVPVEPMLASEFRYCDPLCDENTLVLIISQSGETADTLAALREAKRRGARTLAIVNVVGSSISKEADDVIYTWAGPEIAVATTKAYSTQLAIVDILALYIAQTLKRITKEEYDTILTAFEKLPEQISEILTEENVEIIKQYARQFHQVEDVYFIGRHVDNATCLEGSLKLKEIAYIHSEAYAAGELKHGPISLIEDGTLVVSVATNGMLFDKTMSNIKETKARGAKVLGITNRTHAQRMLDTVDCEFVIPDTEPILQPSLSVVPLQLFSYYVSLERGCDIDKPRNLAKSVTVE
ncbi:MAG: glutamine--fructose-6-phosphate transaminase (isomerizing) [Oscillospiraceae bacterium]|nr:glutamine--fructose-6-phosphate transaminase (isomerizing) [Oscillospiraceae bacterium]